MRVLLLLFAAVSLLAGCGNKHIEAAHKAVSTLLNEPRRASFREEVVYLKDDGQGVAVCGWVNDWNEAKGYVGHRRYIVDGDYARVVSDENLSDFNGKYMEVCK